MTDEVQRRLEEDKERLRREVYPGDLMADIRPRLRAPARGRSWRWLAAAAAALALAIWAARKEPVPPARSRTPSVSPIQTVHLPAPPAVRLPTLSAAGVPSMGAALRGGARALSQVRPPSPSSPNKEE